MGVRHKRKGPVTNLSRQIPKTTLAKWKHPKQKEQTRQITPRIQETSHRVNASAHLFRDLFDMMCLKNIDVRQSDKNLL